MRLIDADELKEQFTNLTTGKEVSFEGSLREIIKREDEKESIKLQNSQMYDQNPKNVLMGQSPEQIAFLKK